MKRLNIYDFAAVILFLAFVCGSILVVRTYEQKEQNFPVWKTIEYGNYENADVLHKALESAGFKIEYWAGDIFNKVPISKKVTSWTVDVPTGKVIANGSSFNLSLVSAAQLGFKDRVPYKNIYERAQEFGLKLLPAEAGPQLRLQYQDQPDGEWLHIAMEPIIDSGGDPTIFDVMHYDHPVHDNNNPFAHGDHYGLQLCSSSVRSDVLWSPSSKWVFQK